MNQQLQLWHMEWINNKTGSLQFMI